MIAFCSSPRFTEHDTGPHHPERPERINAIYTALHRAGLLASANPFPDFRLDLGTLPRFTERLLELPCKPADPKWLLTVHTPAHVRSIERICHIGGGVLDQGDTFVGPNGMEMGLLSVGAALRCCDEVMAGQVTRAFAAVRPPGHHAEPTRPMGFCLFCNTAIAARYLQRQYGLERIAIVDFDVHHGNGTQACFEDDPTVFYVSLHQDPRTCYPGSGYDWETGSGSGRGYLLNFPFSQGSGDAEYMKVLDVFVIPELEDFRPDALIISAGFDAHADDPLAQVCLSEEGFELMTRSLAALADRCCGGRVVSVLEGGYNLRVLGRGVLRHLIGLGAK